MLASESAYAAEGERRRVGLSNAHTSPHHSITLTRAGSFVQVRELGTGGVSSTRVGRSTISTFTGQSRRRLMALCAQVDTAAMIRGLFVTLTYPGIYEGSAREWKRDLDSFGKRVRRKWPKAAIIWRLEYQERGAPHYHLIVLNVPYMAYQWVARNWSEVVGSGDTRHLEAGTEVRRVRAYRQVVAYASKYLAKEAPTCPIDPPGRFWGVIGREDIPKELQRFVLGPDAYERVLAEMKRLAGWEGDELDHLAYTRGLWLMLDKRTQRSLVKLAGPLTSLATGEIHHG